MNKPDNQSGSYFYNTAADAAISIMRSGLKYLFVDHADELSKRPRFRLIYSGARKADHVVNVSTLAGVEELYKGINFGAMMGVVNKEMRQGLNYGTVMAALETMDGGLNFSPVLGIVTELQSGINFGGIAVCHGEVGEDAYHGGVIVYAGKVSGKVLALLSFCPSNGGDVKSFINVCRNGAGIEVKFLGDADAWNELSGLFREYRDLFRDYLEGIKADLQSL